MSDFMNSVKDSFAALPGWGKAALGVVALGGSSLLVLKFFNKRRKSPYKTDYQTNVVYLYDHPRAAVLPNLSSYGLKLETWLRLANINYEKVKIPFGITSKEGMLPFVELNGVEYDDSSFIIRDLTKLLKKEQIEGPLSAEQKAASRAFEQMLDNSTFPSFAYIRITEHLDEYFSEKILGARLPIWFRIMFPVCYIKREGLRRLWCHGIGRHSPQEIVGIGLDDIKSISTYLSTKQYFHGDTATRVDAFIFGNLAQILYYPSDSPHKKLMTTECRNLVRFCDRMKAKYWPDWEDLCVTKALDTSKK